MLIYYYFHIHNNQRKKEMTIERQAYRDAWTVNASRT